MIQVTSEEADLLRVARAVVGLSSYAEVERVLAGQRAAPAQLGPTAMQLLQDTLSRGIGLAVMRGGGWRQQAQKRLWERGPLPGLEFEEASFQLLRWMLASPLADTTQKALPGRGSDSLADETLLALALTLVAETPCERGLAMLPRVRKSALCWVMQPAALARAEQMPDALPDFSGTTLTFLLEAWQPMLARAWARIELTKGDIEDPAELTRIGKAQAAVLKGLFAAATTVKHRALLGFLVEAGAQVLTGRRDSGDWTRNLLPTTPLRERTEARKQSAAFLKALGTLRIWDAEHRAVRFFEDDYAQAQDLVKAWEPLGDAGFREAERLVSELENPV